MKETTLREMKHIAVNFSLMKRASGYRMDTNSLTILAVADLFKRDFVRCVKVSGSFLFVIPTKHLFEMQLKI
jgi:hypothetical protein